MTNTVSVLYGWDSHYPPPYSVIGVYASEGDAERDKQRLEGADSRETLSEGHDWPDHLTWAPHERDRPLGCEHFDVREEPLR